MEPKNAPAHGSQTSPFHSVARGTLHATVNSTDSSGGIMATIAIAYATQHGHTAKVAEYLAAPMRRHGLDVHLYDTDNLPRGLSVERLDAVIVAAPIHAGGY